jgi:ABC-type bacteriocin/lantibiotic exporter with double-glycine peptidase domain
MKDEIIGSIVGFNLAIIIFMCMIAPIINIKLFFVPILMFFAISIFPCIACKLIKNKKVENIKK